MLMTSAPSGSTFTGRNGVTYTAPGTNLYVEPADVPLALRSGWVESSVQSAVGLGASLSTSDQRTFETYLSQYGATFNGSSDDAPAIQSAVNALAADNKDHNITFPSGNLTAAIKSNTATIYGLNTGAGTDAAGIAVPSNVSIDFNQCTLAGAGLSGAVIAFTGNSAFANSYGRNRINYRNGIFTATAGCNSLVVIRNSAGDAGPAREVFSNMFFTAGTSQHLVLVGENTYVCTFRECDFRGGALDQFARVGSLTNEGELYRFVSSSFFNCQTASAIALKLDNMDTVFAGCSFDYNAQHFQMNAAVATLLGCHVEFNKIAAYYPASNGYQVQFTSGFSSSWMMYGGKIQVGGGSGNTLAGIFDPSTKGDAAPFGIVLNQVQRNLNGLTLNNASGTTRFTDNQ